MVAWYSLLITVALKSAAILSLATLAALILRRQTAAARHMVWTVAFLALLALPVLSVSLPSVPVPIPDRVPAVIFQTTATSSSVASTGVRATNPARAGTTTSKGTMLPDW